LAPGLPAKGLRSGSYRRPPAEPVAGGCGRLAETEEIPPAGGSRGRRPENNLDSVGRDRGVDVDRTARDVRPDERRTLDSPPHRSLRDTPGTVCVRYNTEFRPVFSVSGRVPAEIR